MIHSINGTISYSEKSYHGIVKETQKIIGLMLFKKKEHYMLKCSHIIVMHIIAKSIVTRMFFSKINHQTNVIICWMIFYKSYFLSNSEGETYSSSITERYPAFGPFAQKRLSSFLLKIDIKNGAF